MSNAELITEPIELPTRQRPPLRAVTSTPRRRLRPKPLFAIVAIAMAALIAGAQVTLSVLIAQDSYVLADLSAQQGELDLQIDALQEDLAGASSPQALALKAAELGLVLDGTPAHLRLSDGSVAGDGRVATHNSTVNPGGSGAVDNALLDDAQAPPADDTDTETTPSDGETVTDPVEETDPYPSVGTSIPTPNTH